MVKLSLFALAAALAVETASAQPQPKSLVFDTDPPKSDGLNPSGMPNVFYTTSWGDWQWCCQDGGCGDACARVNSPEWEAEWGPNSAKYQEQLESLADAPEEVLDGDALTNVDFVQAKCRMVHQFKCCNDPGVCGDPHFKTWTGDWYDYQGQCELKFLSAPEFGNGIGLDIHIRTTIRGSWSFIESAAVKIGDDILEVGSYGEYFFNGVEDADLPAMMGGKFPVGYYQRSYKEHVFDIFLGDDRRILIKNLKEWVSVHIDQPNYLDFINSVGMMGDYQTGALLGRDGVTVFTDENAFGQEWQVQPDEPQLFVKTTFEPAHPEKCILPVVDEAEQAEQRRLLEAAGITREKAEQACAHLESKSHFCVQDVLSSGDLEAANVF